MSDTYLVDSVDTTLASLRVYGCTTAAVFSELHSHLASLERDVLLTFCVVSLR